MFDKKIKIYPCRGMTGRIKEDVVKEARRDKEFMEKAGIEVLCPVLKEKVAATKAILSSDLKHMLIYWPQDKKMIREAHVVFDMTPQLNSEGVKHEIGYARYHLWKKVIRIYPAGQIPPSSSIAAMEDDYLTDNLIDAIGEAYRTHGSWLKRAIWRLKIYKRSWLKAKWYRMLEFLR
jgi:hypothetical protein